MNTNDVSKIYSPLGALRLLDIRVILDGKEVYSGMVENAPEEIKKMKYSNVEMGNKIVYYVDSKLQK